MNEAFNIQDVPHPYKFGAPKIRTVIGPGLLAQSLHGLLKINLDQTIPEEQLLAWKGFFNHAFVMGRRAAQSEMRHALGIRLDGYDFKLMED